MAIKIGTTQKELSSHGGLLIIEALAKKMNIEARLQGIVPRKKRGSAPLAKKVMDLIYGLAAGAECLDDMEKLGHDKGMTAICNGRVHHPKTYGDTLREFDETQILELRKFSGALGLEFRLACEGMAPERLILDCDSTKNQQYGTKMEGVAFCHQQFLALDTLNVYDELGFQYHLDVRPGNTHTSKNSPLAIHEVRSLLNRRPELKKTKCWMRADSGYYGSGFIEACIAANFDPIVAVPQTPAFAKVISKIRKWRATDPSDPNRIMMKKNQEVEIGVTTHRMEGLSRRLNYIVMRSPRKNDDGVLFQDHVEYDYFAICTTLDFHIISPENVVKTYRSRGQAENFIKEVLTSGITRVRSSPPTESMRCSRKLLTTCFDF